MRTIYSHMVIKENLADPLKKKQEMPKLSKNIYNVIRLRMGIPTDKRI